MGTTNRRGASWKTGFVAQLFYPQGERHILRVTSVTATMMRLSSEGVERAFLYPAGG